MAKIKAFTDDRGMGNGLWCQECAQSLYDGRGEFSILKFYLLDAFICDICKKRFAVPKRQERSKK
jgi:hypothetical protein